MVQELKDVSRLKIVFSSLNSSYQIMRGKMEKNLSLLMFTFTFVFFGVLSNRVEAFDGSPTNSSFKANKVARTIEFNMKYAGLKKECKSKFGSICDRAIMYADYVSQVAWSICEDGFSTVEQCYLAQNRALYVFDNAMETCRRESELEYPPVSSNQKRKDELPINSSPEPQKEIIVTK